MAIYLTRKKKQAAPVPQQDAEYSVGYGKPPKHSQFQKGVSGNPKGRHKGDKNMRTLFEEELNNNITVTVDGKPKTVAVKHALCKRLVADALKGNNKAMDMIIKLAGDEIKEHVEEAAQALTPQEQELFDAYFNK